MRHIGRYSLLAMAIALLLCITAWYYVDIPIAQSLHTLSHQSFLHRSAVIFTRIGNPFWWTLVTGLLFIPTALGLFWLRQNRIVNELFFFTVSMSLAIMVTTSLKFLLARYRPKMLFQSDKYGFHFLSNHFLTNSMPSAHTTCIFAVATILSLTFRRFTPLFIAIAILVGVSRLILGMHYVSDVLLGALIGTLIPLWSKELLFPYHSNTL